MRHEKIIKRADGSRVKIIVMFYLTEYREGPNYMTEVITCPPGKRTFYGVVDGDDYRFRAMTMEERAVYAEEQKLKHVSAEELLSAKLELWQLIKPS